MNYSKFYPLVQWIGWRDNLQGTFVFSMSLSWNIDTSRGWWFGTSFCIYLEYTSQLTNSNLFQGVGITNQTIFAIVLMGGICTIHRDTVWPGLLHRMCWPTSFASSPWAYQAPLGCLLLDAAAHPMTLKLSDGGPRADAWKMGDDTGT